MKKLTLLALTTVLLSSCGFSIVQEGYRGIETNWGKVLGDPLMPGLHFYNPVSDSVFQMDVQEQQLSGKEECFTRDTQSIMISYSLTYYPKQEQIGKLYSQFGLKWVDKIVLPPLQTALKDVIGLFVADDIISKREEARTAAFKDVVETLAARNIVATRLDFTNLDFRDEYEKAVEEKVVAIQHAAGAKNKTVQVREEAEQKILAAKADAEAMRIKSQALSQNKGLVQYEAVQKWDGKLPVNMYGGSVTPFINLKPAKEE